MTRGRPHKPPRNQFDALLKDSGVGFSDIARLCGVSVVTVQNWATGKTKPNMTNAIRLSNLLGITPLELLKFVKIT